MNSIKIIEDKIVLDSINQAIWFIDQYRKVVIDFFYDPRNICSYEWMANAIRLGLESKEVSLNDLMRTDSVLLEKLISSDSIEITQLLKKMDHPPKSSICSSKDNYDIQQKKKIRFVDPLVEVAGHIVSVSSISQNAQIKIKRVLYESKKGIFLKFD